jgi:hypothetical protein
MTGLSLHRFAPLCVAWIAGCGGGTVGDSDLGHAVDAGIGASDGAAPLDATTTADGPTGCVATVPATHLTEQTCVDGMKMFTCLADPTDEIIPDDY